MCGEQRTWIPLSCRNPGSPPRVRGTVTLASVPGSPVGITPACAGNRVSDRTSQHLSEDHPRVCGEQPIRKNLPNSRIGSPPRVRGTALVSNHLQFFCRITPACAGNRFLLLPAGIVAWDHPRVCGEQYPQPLPGMQMQGSPPRVRGTGYVFPF